MLSFRVIRGFRGKLSESLRLSFELFAEIRSGRALLYFEQAGEWALVHDFSTGWTAARADFHDVICFRE